MSTLAPPGSTAAATSAVGQRRPGRRGRRDGLTAHQLFLIPVAAVFVVLFVIPLGQTAYWSFTDFSGYSTDVTFVGLKNYRLILSDASMLAGLTFTILFAIGTTLLVTVVAVPLAVALNRRFLGRNLVRSVFFFPSVPSLAILGLVWGYILSPLGSGVLNSALEKLFGAGPVPWLSDANLARGSVIAVAVWGTAGWHAVLYLAYLQSIPAEYYEVATLDGASALQQFRRITLPLLTPAIVISQFLLMTGGLKVFDLPYTLTKGGPGYATQTITQSIITSGVGQGRYGLASALAVVFTIAVAAFSIGQLLVSRRIERSVL
ncbi:carbohydrate ABC transporter permease [Plantactinospora soyae]|uniref:Multiple sugar transport system permease protein/raffinose/stachyose/melibiose transport system permease protein n=1 Tax=Plantactinospora soyae TaxID=1544732 RepID=A0A927MA65_9ACTN|nr:sugar ABC transporter permease [Plantactinospora soyae]MBE1490837.1 multiple sugar transport system permease protein/raffinose/stachyose/melibiose transport system permease protein [Plantactinospora soyae]